MRIILLEDSPTLRATFCAAMKSMAPDIEVVAVADMTEFLKRRWGCAAAVLDVHTESIGGEVLGLTSRYIPIPHCTWSDTAVEGITGFRKRDIRGVVKWLEGRETGRLENEGPPLTNPPPRERGD